MANDASSYQWYFNGTILPGATDQIYTPVLEGNYSVEITDENDCSALSDEFAWEPLSINEADNLHFEIYPNPASDIAMLTFSNNEHANVLIDVFNILGEKTASYITNESELILNLKMLSNGIYSVNVSIQGKLMASKQLVISR